VGDALTRPPTVTLAFDDGVAAGLGHRRRMETLAAALTDLGCTCALLPTGALDGSGDIVVVDSYARRADQLGLAPVVAIDDLERDLAVDLVVDPCPGATVTASGRARAVLAGASYAPLDRRLPATPTRPPRGGRQDILVATGGADREGHGFTLAGAIAAHFGSRHGVRLAVGPGATPGTASGVELVHRSDGIAPELGRADIVVTAGGVTLLEALALGRPTVALALYDNQRRQVRGAAALGAALMVEPDGVVDAVDALVASLDTRCALSSRARAAVDGHGARRVAEAVIGLA